MSDTSVDLTESRSTEIIVVAWVFTGLAIVIVALKLFARAQIIMRVGWDDFFIFISLVRGPISAHINNLGVDAQY